MREKSWESKCSTGIPFESLHARAVGVRLSSVPQIFPRSITGLVGQIPCHWGSSKLLGRASIFPGLLIRHVSCSDRAILLGPSQKRPNLKGRASLIVPRGRGVRGAATAWSGPRHPSASHRAESRKKRLDNRLRLNGRYANTIKTADGTKRCR